MKVAVKNQAGTIESLLRNDATGIRNWLVKDEDGTFAFIGDLAALQVILEAAIASGDITAVNDSNLYTDSRFTDHPWKFAVDVATTVALPANTMVDSNTMEASVVGALPAIDGITNPVTAVFKNEPDAKRNGLWIFTGYGSGGSKWTASRVGGISLGMILDSAVVNVRKGTVNAGKRFKQITLEPEFGTDDIVWQEEIIVQEPISSSLVSTAIKMDKPRHYGESAAISAGTITLDSTDLHRGVMVVIRHNAAAMPIMTGFLVSNPGDYVPSVDNYLYCYSFSSSIIQVTVNQF